MLRKRLLWLGKCLLLCLLGIFIAGRLSDMLNPLIWWALHENGTTLLERPAFIASYYLPLIGIYGLLLGVDSYSPIARAASSGSWQVSVQI
jgi:hypothetical protein